MSLSTREAYGKTLENLAEKYDFWVMDADLSKATKTCDFAAKYPHRFINMGISEADMMTTAAGIASCDQTVFVSTFAIFAACRACEQIRNSIAYTNLNVKIAATHGGVLIGADGGSHQAIEDIAIMRSIPNMTVLVPCDEVSTFQCVEKAINHNGPVYIRLGRFDSTDIYSDDCSDFEIGKSNVIVDGKDITFIAIGDMVAQCKKASKMLENMGISAAVIDMYSIKPIDEETIIKYAKKTNAIITCEDHNFMGGLYSAVAEVTAKKCPTKMSYIAIKDEFGRSGSPKELLIEYGLSAKHMVKEAVNILK